MKTISFTIPMESGPLIAVAETLMNLAGSLPASLPTTGSLTTSPGANDGLHVGTTAAEEIKLPPVAEVPAVEVFLPDDAEDDATLIPKTDQEVAAAFKAKVDGPALEPALDPEAISAIMAPAALAGVELDADGLPWDGRIHASTKTKLAKSNQWKKIRGLEKKSPGLIATVEAELHAAMAAGPHAPITPAPPAAETPAPPAAETPAPPAAETPAPPAAPAPGAITNIAELVKAITDAKLPSETVLAAVNAQGLSGLPFLAARPDLVPAVALALFPKG